MILATKLVSICHSIVERAVTVWSRVGNFVYLLNFCYLLYLTFVYLTFVTSFTNTLLTFLFVLVLPFRAQLFLLSRTLVLSASAFRTNADLWGRVSTDAFLDIALWILLQFSVVISFYLSFTLVIYLFITLSVRLSPFLSALV